MKVHAVTDGLGNPLRFLLSSGNCNDICMAQTPLEPFDLRGRLILADKGHDSDKFVRWVEEQGGIVVIPSRTNVYLPVVEPVSIFCKKSLSRCKIRGRTLPLLLMSYILLICNKYYKLFYIRFKEC